MTRDAGPVIGKGMDDALLARLFALIEPLNSKAVPLTPETSFADDLAFDSLTVMDLVASMEDEWDINVPLNILPDLETIGDVADAIARLKDG
jgi:acyl carrier protein